MKQTLASHTHVVNPVTPTKRSQDPPTGYEINPCDVTTGRMSLTRFTNLLYRTTQIAAQKCAVCTDTVLYLCDRRLTGSADSVVAGQRHVELGNRPGEGFVVRQALRGAVLPAARPEQHRLVVALLRYDLRRTRRLQHQQKQQ